LQKLNYNEDDEILRQCRTGNLHAFERLYKKYSDGLYRTAHRMLGSKEEAEDALQITFTKLYQAMENFRGEAKLSTYIFRILLNVCHDLNRKHKSIERDYQPDFIFQPRHELQIQLDDAIRLLPERMRECFVLFAIEGFKQSEIAGMLNVTTGTVKAHIFQAKEKLKSSLNGVF